jgi:hypothetical protein
VQVKTSANPTDPANFPFALPVKNYDELRDPTNPTTNAATMRVWLMKSSLFHVDQLRAIMQRLLEGKLP